MSTRTLFALIFAALLVPAAAHAQYELDEVSAHLGGGLRMLSGDGVRYLGPGAATTASWTHYPCGKAYAIEGRAGFFFGHARSSDNHALAGDSLAGASALTLAGAEVSAAFKIRLHDYHRPREFAFLIGPKVMLPFLALHQTESKSGSAADAGIQVNRIAPAVFFAMQFRKPAPDKKSWFIEPGVEFNPTPLLRREGGPALGALYAYIQFGFAFWDQRG